MIDVTPGELIHRIWYAKHYADGLFKEGSGGAFASEYPACPLTAIWEGIYQDQIFMAGFHGQYPDWDDSKIYDEVISYDKDEMYVDFKNKDNSNAYESPKLYVKRDYSEDGQTDYTMVLKRNINGLRKLYLGDYHFATIDESTPMETTWVVQGEKWRGYPSHRYTLRHASQLQEKIYKLCGETAKSDALRALLNTHGFTYDIYDPLFVHSVNEADDYMYDNQAYHDCDFGKNHDVDALPWGMDPHRYAYESKVCAIGRSEYILISRKDRLCRILQAIHILNKYSDPDHEYPHPDPSMSGITITPRVVARDMEQNCWNGHGINAYNAGGPSGPPYDLASGVRTSVFSVLETLLGFKYYDSTSRKWAKDVIDVLVDVQWGVQRPHNVDGKGIYDGLDTLLRPPHIGGCLGGWVESNSFAYSYHEGILDMFNMPDEDKGALPTNMEANATHFQALRTYLHYAHGIDCPTSSLIP